MKSILIANWKMNPETFKEAKQLFEATKKAADKTTNVSIVVAPPSLYIRELRASYRGKKLSFAIQGAHPEAGGAHTGEISLAQAKDAGALYAIIGHAERRASGETNEDTKKQVATCLQLGMMPILCVGESKRGREGEHFAFIQEQLRAGCAEVKAEKIGKVIIAYEPVWAIGGTTAVAPHDMHEMAVFIRKMLNDLYGAKGMAVKVLYGGAIDESNAVHMLQEGDVSGLLVGRASADAQKLSDLLRVIQNA